MSSNSTDSPSTSIESNSDASECKLFDTVSIAIDDKFNYTHFQDIRISLNKINMFSDILETIYSKLCGSILDLSQRWGSQEFDIEILNKELKRHNEFSNSKICGDTSESEAWINLTKLYKLTSLESKFLHSYIHDTMLFQTFGMNIEVSRISKLSEFIVGSNGEYVGGLRCALYTYLSLIGVKGKIYDIIPYNTSMKSDSLAIDFIGNILQLKRLDTFLNGMQDRKLFEVAISGCDLVDTSKIDSSCLLLSPAAQERELICIHNINRRCSIHSYHTSQDFHITNDYIFQYANV